MNRIVLTGCVALGTIGVLAVSQSSVRAEPKASGLDPDRALFVTLVSPSRNRHTLPDLSDPGLNNVITVRFSTFVTKSDVVDDQTQPNGLSRKCEFRDQTLATVPAEASVFRNTLTINPFSSPQRPPVLAIGRYTLTLKPSIRSARGRMLNDGVAAFTTTFYVGSGTAFAPVLRRVAPFDGQTGVGLHRAVVATFEGCFELDPGGRIRRWREFYDPAAVQAAFPRR